MYCKKCGTEQHDGYKYCPKCGMPFTEADKIIDNNPINSSESLTEEEPKKEATEQGHQEEEKKVDDSLPLSSDKEKKVKLTAKAGMWIILIAIVATFIRTGFGFSFWWYIFLLVFAGVAFLLWGVLLPNTDADKKPLTTSDASLVKVLFYVGAAMFVILYLWGPLNSDYTSGSDYSYERSSNDSSNNISKWLTESKFVCELDYGGKSIIKLNDDGTAHWAVYDNTGALLKIPYEGGYAEWSFHGTYNVRDNHVYISFKSVYKTITLKIDSELQRLYGEGGGVFKQSAS